MSVSPHERGVIALALSRPIGVVMSLILATVLGVIAYHRLPLQLLPDGFTPPFMWIQIPTLAASPEESQEFVAKPLEDALATLAEIERLTTHIRTNNVGFGVHIRANSDLDLSYTRIRARLRRHLPSLPEGAQRAIIWRHDPNEDPLYVFSVTYPPEHPNPAHIIREEVVKRLERIDGVSRVEINGIKESAVRIEVKPQALKRARISAQQVLSTLRADHFTQTAGRLREGDRTLWVNASSRFSDLEALRARPITSHLTLGDLAEVKLAPDPRPVVHRVNGAPSCSITIYKVSTENAIEVTQRVERELETLFSEQTSLQEMKYLEFFNQGQFIKTSLDQIKNSAFYGGIIALLCLFFFLRSVKLTLMITAAIPLCLLITIALLYLRDQSLNILSMMGVILSVGMVIDNAIVVLEQIVQRRREGWGARAAALLGTRGVALAVALATSTTLVVFLPLMMVNDQPMLGLFISSIGEPVCYALGASLIIALVHLPTLSQYVHSARWMREAEDRRVSHEAPVSPITEVSQDQAQDELSGSTAHLLMIDRLYHRVLRWVISHRLVMSFLTFLFLISVGYPASQLNRVDRGGGAFRTLSINILGPLNGPRDRLDDVAREIERRLLPQLSTLDIKSMVSAQGWSPEHLRISLYLTPPARRALLSSERQKRLKELLPSPPGYRVLLRRGMGENSQGVTIAVYGAYLDRTTEIAQRLKRRLKLLPEIDDVEFDLPEGGLELKLRVDSAWSQLNQLNPAWISSSVNAELQERLLGDFITPQGAVNILLAPQTRELKLHEVGRSVPKMSSNLSTPDPTPNSVRSDTNAPTDRLLDGFVTRQLELGSGKIRRKQRRVQVQMKVLGESGAVMSALERFIPTFYMPMGYGVDYGERFKNRRKNERGGGLAVLMGILLVLCLMGMLFESLLTPLAILGTIPLAFVGSIWTLWACGTSFEVMAMIGGVILVGVVVNNGIVLIDQIQGLRRAGASRDQAILTAATTRLRPILMTAMTTIGGLLPMAFSGGEVVGIDYQPLGQVVIGGLTSSTLLTLVVVPLLYTFFDDLSAAPQEARAWQHHFSKRLRARFKSSARSSRTTSQKPPHVP